jgi:L-2-hydroxyglutarate oxidase LhgO
MDVNITIIGAGVIGLSIARELSSEYSDVFMIEKNKSFGQEISSRNSEVIHSGIYYPKNSLKSILCVEGKELLYKYCKEKKINHKKIGKLIIATNSEEDKQLQLLLKNAKNNGVHDGEYLSYEEIKKIEPNIKVFSALFYPSTGIIDSYGLLKQLEADAKNNGANAVYNTEVIEIKKLTKGYLVSVKDNSSKFSFTTKVLINAAGLFSDKISFLAGISDPLYNLYFWKGEYFSVINGKNKYISHLIYPVPYKNNIGLGIHATLDVNNRMKLGPNAIFLPNKIIDYKVNENRKFDFFNSVRHFLPFIELDDLQPEQCGIRPKLQKPGDAFRDFIIKNEAERGFENFINLIGIESPGLTSCLSIAKMVKNILV